MAALLMPPSSYQALGPHSPATSVCRALAESGPFWGSGVTQAQTDCLAH